MAVAFGRDRFSLTLVAALALIAVIMGKDALPTLAFASAFMIVLPVLRYLKLLA